MRPVSKATVVKMREAYNDTIRKTSTENLKKKHPGRPWIEEASSAWVSRKELDELLNANNADGLRIYYGCHFNSTDADPKKDYLGLHNLIFVATVDSVDPQNPTYANSTDQLRDTAGAANASLAEPSDYDGNAGEFVTLCPPYCPTLPVE